MSKEKIRILTWNFHKKASVFKHEALNEMLVENKIDILCLQESYNPLFYTVLPPNFVEVIYNNKETNGVRIFLKSNLFKYSQAEKIHHNKLVMITLKHIQSNVEFNFFAVHLYSKVGQSSRTQMWQNKRIIDLIEDFEGKSSCKNKSMMVGDFNNNPYEINLLDPKMLNTRESKSLIESHSKIKHDKKFWYNPMWNFLGDWKIDDSYNNVKIGGSFFSTHYEDEPYWHLIDGVLLRQDLMHNLFLDESKIIHKTKHKNFLKNQIFNHSESLIHEDFSDHLPFMFTLKF